MKERKGKNWKSEKKIKRKKERKKEWMNERKNKIKIGSGLVNKKKRIR